MSKQKVETAGEEKILSDKPDCQFILTEEWLFINSELRYIGTVTEIATNEMMCGLICDTTNGAYIDLITGKKTGPVDCFVSLLSKLGAELTSDWKVYKLHKPKH